MAALKRGRASSPDESNAGSSISLRGRPKTWSELSEAVERSLERTRRILRLPSASFAERLVRRGSPCPAMPQWLDQPDLLPQTPPAPAISNVMKSRRTLGLQPVTEVGIDVAPDARVAKVKIPWLVVPLAIDLFSFDASSPDVVTCKVCPDGRKHRLLIRRIRNLPSMSGGVRYQCRTLFHTRSACPPHVFNHGFVSVKPRDVHAGGEIATSGANPSLDARDGGARPGAGAATGEALTGGSEIPGQEPLALADSEELSAAAASSDRVSASRQLIANVLALSKPRTTS